jgi:hypothetical protein
MTTLNHARRHADSEAQEARELILGMSDKHANIYLVLDAVREVIAEVTWADAPEATEAAAKALAAWGDVYANQRAAA